MAKFHNFQTNFSGGLLSEGMLGRVDLAQYENGCKQLTNWWPKVTGGMRRRPGSVFLDHATEANSNDYARLESFIFSETQAYLVTFTNLEVVIRDLDGNEIETLAHTYDNDAVRELSITQLGDVMFVAHESEIMHELRRTSATTFTWTDFEFEGTGEDNEYPKKMPFVKYADQFVTISPNGYLKGGVISLTASAAVFNVGMVGRAVRYRGKQMKVLAFNSPTSLAVSILEELDQGAVLSITTVENRPHDFIIGEIIVGRDSGIKAEVVQTDTNSISVSMIAGTFPALVEEDIEGLESGNVATITGNVNTNPLPSSDWDEEAFSDERGYPSVIEFHSQRLWLGGSSSLPAHIFGSRVAAFFNFDVGDAFPADSIQVAIVGKQINLVTDIVSGRHLQVFTDKSEFYAPQSEDRPLVPETFDLLPQTRYGSKRTIEPKVFDESTIFVQAQGSAVREFQWQDQGKGYASDAISLIAEEHLNDIQEVEILYGGYDRPEQIAFFVNGDGTITWYHSARAESIRTWGKWTTDGNYRSLTVINDKLYALVTRDWSNSSGQWFLERFELTSTMDAESWDTFVGGKRVWQGTATHNSNNNLDVCVSADAINGTDRMASHHYLGQLFLGLNGSIDLTPFLGITGSVNNITVGRPFTQELEIMPIEVKDQQGVTGGKAKRIVYADIYIASTLAIELNGEHIHAYQAELDLTQKPEKITGLRKFYLLGYSDRPTLTVTNSVPLDCELLSIGAEVEY